MDVHLKQKLGLIFMYALCYCLVRRPSDNIRLHYEQLSACYPSKLQHSFIFSWHRAPKQGSLAPTHDALNPKFNCGSCVVLGLKASPFLDQTEATSMCLNSSSFPVEYHQTKARSSLLFKKNSVWLSCAALRVKGSLWNENNDKNHWLVTQTRMLRCPVAGSVDLCSVLFYVSWKLILKS